MKRLLIAALLAATPAAAHNNVPHDQGLPRATIYQLHALTEAIEPYRDFENARRKGWKKVGSDEPLMGEHSHPGEEIIYVLEGTFEYRVAGKPIRLERGGVLFIPAGTIHSATNTGTGNAVELATYVVEKGRPLLSLAQMGAQRQTPGT